MIKININNGYIICSEELSAISAEDCDTKVYNKII